jgi:hypothetical protein
MYKRILTILDNVFGCFSLIWEKRGVYFKLILLLLWRARAAAREGRVIDGEFVPLSELYPKFKEEELDRCIKIPEDEAPGHELDEILRLIAGRPEVYMITGHVSAEEGVRLVDLAEEYGIGRTVVSSAVTKIASTDQLQYMADKGAYIEYTLAAYTHTTSIPKTHYYVEREYASIDEGMSKEPSVGVKHIAEQIMELGAEHCVISTDFGVYTLPAPVEGLREFIACLLDLGLSHEEIRKLSKENPETILGLAPLSADNNPSARGQPDTQVQPVFEVRFS